LNAPPRSICSYGMHKYETKKQTNDQKKTA
jgi:translation initiation factor IF-3